MTVITCLMFMPQISNWMIFVNGKHPQSLICIPKPEDKEDGW